MFENSFIKFAATMPECAGVPLPILAITDVNFYTNVETWAMHICDLDGDVLGAVTFNGTLTGTGGRKHIELLTGDVNYTGCFVLKITTNEIATTFVYSNPFIYDTDQFNNVVLSYYADKTVFGFDYAADGSTVPNKVRLSMRIHLPQFPQNDEIYTDGVGTRHLLSSRVDKEYTLETDYMTVEMHEKLIVALSHNYVFIWVVFPGATEGTLERLQRSGGYEIDYENEFITDCGEKTYKGTAKLIRNTTLLNLNC